MPWSIIKIPSYQYRNSQCGNKTVVDDNLLFPVQSHLRDIMCSCVIQGYSYQIYLFAKRDSQYSLWISELPYRPPLMAWSSDDKRTHVTKLHRVDMFAIFLWYHIPNAYAWIWRHRCVGWDNFFALRIWIRTPTCINEVDHYYSKRQQQNLMSRVQWPAVDTITNK